MRCRVGPKKVARYRKHTGLPVLTAFVRGGTEHRIDLCLDDGSIMHWFKDGRMEKSEVGWHIAAWEKDREILKGIDHG